MRDEIEEKIKARREERARLDQLTRARVKEVLKDKPAYLKIEERFKRDYETPYLEEKKRQLEEVRSLKKPLAQQSIQEHEQKYKLVQKE